MLRSLTALELVPRSTIVGVPTFGKKIAEVVGMTPNCQLARVLQLLLAPAPSQIESAAMASGPCRKITEAVRNAIARKPRLNCGRLSRASAGALFLVFRKNDVMDNFIWIMAWQG